MVCQNFCWLYRCSLIRSSERSGEVVNNERSAANTYLLDLEIQKTSIFGVRIEISVMMLVVTWDRCLTILTSKSCMTARHLSGACTLSVPDD